MKTKVTGKEMFGRRSVLFFGKVREKEDHGRRKLQKKPPICGRHSICIKS
jgi:hypothetical protein